MSPVAFHRKKTQLVDGRTVIVCEACGRKRLSQGAVGWERGQLICPPCLATYRQVVSVLDKWIGNEK